MNHQKKNFLFGQRVRVESMNYYGIEGTITGIASISWFDVYIVTLDQPMETSATIMPKFSTLTVPEIFLAPIPALELDKVTS